MFCNKNLTFKQFKQFADEKILYINTRIQLRFNLHSKFKIHTYLPYLLTTFTNTRGN